MLSIISGSICFICSSYIGIQIKKYYKRRYELLNDLIWLLGLIFDEIASFREPILNIINKSRLCIENEEFLKVTQDIKNYYENRLNEPNINNIHLKKDERILLNEYFKMLGVSSVDRDKSRTKEIITVLESKSKLSKMEMEKSGTLAYKLGVLIGIALMIILV